MSGSGGGGGSTSTSTPTYVQGGKDTTVGTGVTLPSPVTTGNLIVVGITTWGQSIPANAVTDNKGNTYTKIGEVVNAASGDHAALFYAKNVTGGSSFTVSLVASAAHRSLHTNTPGSATSTPFDKVASSTGLSPLSTREHHHHPRQRTRLSASAGAAAMVTRGHQVPATPCVNRRPTMPLPSASPRKIASSQPRPRRTRPLRSTSSE